MLTIRNIHKIDNMEWETKRGNGVTVKHTARIKENEPERYQIEFTKEYHNPTPQTGHTDRTIVMSIRRKGLENGSYGIGIYENGLLSEHLQRRVQELTILWIMGVIERT